MVPPAVVGESWRATRRLREQSQRLFVWAAVLKPCGPGGRAGRRGKSALQRLAHLSSCWSPPSSKGNRCSLSLSKASGERHKETKSVPPVAAQPAAAQRSARAGGSGADGRPVRGAAAFVSGPVLSPRTVRLLLRLAWESGQAVTQKSPCSLLLRKFSKLSAAKIRDMKVPSAAQSLGANLASLTPPEHPWSAHGGSWPAG